MKQAYSQVFRFGEKNKLLGGQDFCFYYGICLILKQTFLGTTKFGGHKKLGTLPLNNPMATGLE